MDRMSDSPPLSPPYSSPRAGQKRKPSNQDPDLPDSPDTGGNEMFTAPSSTSSSHRDPSNRTPSSIRDSGLTVRRILKDESPSTKCEGNRITLIMDRTRSDKISLQDKKDVNAGQATVDNDEIRQRIVAATRRFLEDERRDTDVEMVDASEDSSDTERRGRFERIPDRRAGEDDEEAL